MPRKQDSAVLTFNFELETTLSPVGGVNYVDLSQCASILNRRFYRQGKNWAVAGFRFSYTGRDDINIDIRSLPTTWVVSGAWMKAFKSWQDQQNMALKASDSMDTKARYNDFKVFMDSAHQLNGVANNLLPQSPGGTLAAGGAGNTPYLTGEWVASQVVIPNAGGPGIPGEFELHMLGASVATSKSILGGYAFSRAKPFSPDPVAPDVGTSWLNQMDDQSESNPDIIDNALDNNDDLPYDQNTYPNQLATNGGVPQLHRSLSFTSTTIGAHADVAGGQFPCGLIQIVHDADLTGDESLTMQVFLVPGDDRGYLLQDMKEMN